MIAVIKQSFVSFATEQLDQQWIVFSDRELTLASRTEQEVSHFPAASALLVGDKKQSVDIYTKCSYDFIMLIDYDKQGGVYSFVRRLVACDYLYFLEQRKAFI